MSDMSVPGGDGTRGSRKRRFVGVGLIFLWVLADALGRAGASGSDPFTWFGALPVLALIPLMIGSALLMRSFKAFESLHEPSDRQLALFRLVSTVLVIAAVVQSVAFGLPTMSAEVPEAARYIVTGLYGLVLATAGIACLLSLSLTWKGGDRPGARALALFMALLAVFWGPVLGRFWLEYEGGQLQFGSSVGNSIEGDLGQAALVLSVAAFVRFSALFPRPLTANDLTQSGPLQTFFAVRKPLLSPSIVWGVAAGLAIVLLWPEAGQTVEGRGVQLDELGLVFTLWFALLWVLFVGLPLLGMTAGAMNLRTSYISSEAAERKKILWVVVGCVAGTCIILAAVGGFFLDNIDSPVFDLAGVFIVGIPFAPLVLVVCLAIAVYYQGTIHPALVIRRATVFGVLGVALVAMLSAVEGLVSEILENALGFSGLLSTAALGALIAVLLMPLRGPVGRWLSPLLPKDAVEATPSEEAVAES